MPQDASSKDLVLKWVEHDLTALVESFPELRWRSCAWLQSIIDMMVSTWVTIYKWERFKDGKRILLHGRSHLSSFCPNDMSRNKQGLNFSPRDRITACQAPLQCTISPHTIRKSTKGIGGETSTTFFTLQRRPNAQRDAGHSQCGSQGLSRIDLKEI